MTQTSENTAEEPAIFRIDPVRPIEELRLDALASEPPREEGPFRPPELVDLAALNSSLRFDIRYATDRNFMGTAFYLQAKAYLQRPAAEALAQVAAELRQGGLGLIIYDAYRPWFVTKMFWDATPDSLKRFVASPDNGSRHNRGAAIDLGLYRLATGEILPMPSGYDEFTERAHADYRGGPDAPRRHRDQLRRVMERRGFSVYPYEWWHFDHEDWSNYPILNLTFEQLTP